MYDSVAGAPLHGATVQLVAPGSTAPVVRTATSDPLGRFAFDDVAYGRYMLGFFHPMLDSLGLEPTVRELIVSEPRTMRVDLAIPSPERLRAVVCGPSVASDSSAVVIGIVRDARNGSPVASGTVSAEWVEFSLSLQGLARRVPRLVATTAENGWFAICDVPRIGMIALIAGHGADSTDLVEVPAPAGALLRRDLYVAPPRASGGLSGAVVAAGRLEGLAGALVRVSGGTPTRADDTGGWSLTGVPIGTRMLEVRAVGYLPERRAVDVVAGAAPIRSTLTSLAAMLDTVKVLGTRIDNIGASGFTDRRRSSLGRYLTAEDIARRHPFATSDLFRMMPGLRLERSPMGGNTLDMRGLTTERCAPAVYLNGQYLSTLTADEIDNFVQPDEIAGIEVYTPGTVPPQFEPAMSGCGSIVIWTRARPGPASRLSASQRVLRVLLVLAAGLLFGSLID